ncbi:hypothetical protein ACFZCP_44225 [Streptomyces sp. NPDC007971]|uniref:hypothetical protein n=1 Tax=Streptomyces sp. NPDC007971 TaxID=3364799 RepID=UPI0036E4BE54
MLLGLASEPVRALATGRGDLTEHLLAPWQQLPGIRLCLETCWLGLAGTGAASLRLAARTLTLADQLGIPAVPTNVVPLVGGDDVHESGQSEAQVRRSAAGHGLCLRP